MNKKILSTECLLKIYYSLIHPYILYGILLWGVTFKYLLKPVLILQKKAIQAVCKKPSNFPTNELFKLTGVPRMDILYDYMLAKFMYRHANFELPYSLQNLFELNSTIHNYDTRAKNEPRRGIYIGRNVKNSFVVKGPRLWSKLPGTIKECGTMYSFSKNVKKWLLNSIDA